MRSGGRLVSDSSVLSFNPVSRYFKLLHDMSGDQRSRNNTEGIVFRGRLGHLKQEEKRLAGQGTHFSFAGKNLRPSRPTNDAIRFELIKKKLLAS